MHADVEHWIEEDDEIEADIHQNVPPSPPPPILDEQIDSSTDDSEHKARL